MGKADETEALWLGFRLAKEHGMSYAQVKDFLEIRRLNRVAKAAWERNQEGGMRPENYEANEKRSDDAWSKAESLASAHGWKLEAPGLYWTVTGPQGRID